MCQQYLDQRTLERAISRARDVIETELDRVSVAPLLPAAAPPSCPSVQRQNCSPDKGPPQKPDSTTSKLVKELEDVFKDPVADRKCPAKPHKSRKTESVRIPGMNDEEMAWLGRGNWNRPANSASALRDAPKTNCSVPR